MWNKIKLILWLIILLAVAYFVSMNTSPNVSVKILPTLQTPEIPLALIIIASIIIGAALIIIFAITDWIAYKIDKMKLSRNLKSTEKELAKCRQQLEEKDKKIEELKIELEVMKNKENITVKQEGVE
ncbi:lipopolysaccharide assembly protein LapA domain-containing protein [Persephonella sp.]|uniref:lipopolysaccharide assembly protein LapA domain-containing protein n=1 Tax=Persephonella sp. TaxID=2060922 RepID=UPI002633BB55|nr:lipopolysaccharide assembly protein LapA domain-containing protein [Persephonella sp.]